MISFEKSKAVEQAEYLLKTVADNMMRPVSRHFDDNEHEIPWDFITFMHDALRAMGAGSVTTREDEQKKEEQKNNGYEFFHIFPSQIKYSMKFYLTYFLNSFR